VDAEHSCDGARPVVGRYKKSCREIGRRAAFQVTDEKPTEVEQRTAGSAIFDPAVFLLMRSPRNRELR
jgi:hypothetical protein